ncbi:CHASE2 domain-containing protein [Mesorhizobium loti]|uniref:CHASE2 domain-containing protein n=1 Tax=Rhizobium loti TaxID=381 RepID=UPI0003F6E96C|nr:CHASE2 domain-containing protein [Mesorhizobium loti]
MKDEPGSHSWQDLLRAFAIEWLLLCALAVLVSLVVTGLRHVEAVRSLDRGVTDGIMRELAKARLAGGQAQNTPRYIFVNVGEETCRLWSEARGEACGSGFVTPRKALASMLRALVGANAGRAAMKLVVLDIELAPQPADSMTDSELCAQTYSVAASIPVLAVRPVVTEVFDPARPIARPQPSIFDDLQCNGHALGSPAAQLWFASPLLQPDPDNVVRSIFAWHQIRSDDATERIAGFGLLGAALAGGVDRDNLACLFPGSRHNPQDTCKAAKPFTLAHHHYDPLADDEAIARILFSLPSDAATSTATGYSYAPFVFQTIEAYELQQRLDETPQLLDGAIVVIGGSYAASGDLHATPLGQRMPGAMVHANAIRAIAAGNFVEEHEGWGWEALLIGIASLIGAIFHVAGHRAHERLRSPFNHLAKLGFAAGSIFLTVLVVFILGAVHALHSLASGTAVAVMSPIIAVAFEGMSSILQVVREALSVALAWVQGIQLRRHAAPQSASTADGRKGSNHE